MFGTEFIKAHAGTADVEFAALEGAGQARQGILHEPDVAANLDRAACLPRFRESASRPWPPDASIHRPEQSDSRTACCGGKMGHRGVRPDIKPRSLKQCHGGRPRCRMNSRNALPYVIEIGALGFIRPADRDDDEVALL